MVMKLVESRWVMIDGKRCRYQRYSGTVPTPAQEFLEQRKQAGDNILVATFKLLRSDTPLAPKDRERIAFMLGLLATASSRGKKSESDTWKMIRNKMQADLYRSRFEELKKQGIVGLQAEEKVAAEEGVKVDALRKRIQRSE
jgi:hypothetical protein